MKIKTLAIAALLAALPGANAIVLMGSGDADKNTTAPTGDLAGSGWDLQGFWGNCTGTPVGPNHFITAAHVGGSVGQIFTLNGVDYTTVSSAADPLADLRLWEVRETFPAFAQLFDGPSEVGKTLVVFGRGAIRGAEVNIGDTLGGWRWGARDGRLRWGTNQFTDILPDQGLLQILQVDFNLEAGADEAHIAIADSGGGIFIRQNGDWRLAGINLSVDGPYNHIDSGDGFNAAMFFHAGMFVLGSEGWQLISNATPVGSFYAARLKARQPWIDSILALPTTPHLMISESVEGPYQPATNAVVDGNAKTIRFPLGEGARYFELSSSVERTITTTRLEGTTVVIQYN